MKGATFLLVNFVPQEADDCNLVHYLNYINILCLENKQEDNVIYGIGLMPLSISKDFD
jgi:hypothetical protein